MPSVETQDDTGQCRECGLDYSEFGGDLHVPDTVWLSISPGDHDSGGLLCANCLIQALRDSDMDDPVAATIWLEP